MKSWLSDDSFGLQWMVLINFLSDFPQRMTRSRMSFSLPPKLTELHIRIAPSTLRQGSQEEDDELLLAFSLALSTIFALEILLACDRDS